MGRLAIVSAMESELRGLLASLPQAECVRRAGREFWVGSLGGHEVVLVRSLIGKVAAATTAAVLLEHFGVESLLFTGVAGGLGADVRIGDIVVAGDLLQHDMDASPIFPRFEVPLYGTDRFTADAALSARLHAACEEVLTAIEAGRCEELSRAQLEDCGVRHAPRVHRGLILSGDRFVSSAAEARALQADHPAALAVEMEGAALAQVAHDFGVPCAVMRTISDRADDSAHVDFNRFIADVASRYTHAVAMSLLGMAG
ncbi:5'-methylthioadenosine/adenosylhomocysteine nucleosidase [Azohydromonas caseinilytica]|uniref:adenosylhomocysteine nucleosidase n=1 Tax=Azohydromonas caseinilytica TaxID=2728836 RepID=A0A848FEB5_9BURK|nr:5'-methylthioadenosine/adenosylhomocysteine nucleosidase [Azohydromonas caseinilytica]NML17642.1 5'-methylthioadenosine/adenosylhomocysteine nucleosidase [Azohydromonas caseinilytica]